MTKLLLTHRQQIARAETPIQNIVAEAQADLQRLIPGFRLSGAADPFRRALFVEHIDAIAEVETEPTTRKPPPA